MDSALLGEGVLFAHDDAIRRFMHEVISPVPAYGHSCLYAMRVFVIVIICMFDYCCYCSYNMKTCFVCDCVCDCVCQPGAFHSPLSHRVMPASARVFACLVQCEAVRRMHLTRDIFGAAGVGVGVGVSPFRSDSAARCSGEGG